MPVVFLCPSSCLSQGKYTAPLCPCLQPVRLAPVSQDRRAWLWLRLILGQALGHPHPLPSNADAVEPVTPRASSGSAIIISRRPGACGPGAWGLTHWGSLPYSTTYHCVALSQVYNHQWLHGGPDIPFRVTMKDVT